MGQREVSASGRGRAVQCGSKASLAIVSDCCIENEEVEQRMTVYLYHIQGTGRRRVPATHSCWRAVTCGCHARTGTKTRPGEDSSCERVNT